MRTNGYDFHVELMAGKAAWTDAKVKDVFDTWRGLLPYHQEGANGRTWQEAAQTLVQEGRHVPARAPSSASSSAARRPRTSTSSLPGDRPGTARTRSRRRSTASCCRRSPKNEAAGKELLEYLATPEAEEIYLKTDPNNVAAQQQGRHLLLHRAAEEGGRARLRRQADLAVHGPRHPARLRLDGDDPGAPEVHHNPKDIDGLLLDIERQKKTIFAADWAADPPVPDTAAARACQRQATAAARLLTAVTVVAAWSAYRCPPRALVWGPTLASVALSFTTWDGIGVRHDPVGRHPRTTRSSSPTTRSSGRPSGTTCIWLVFLGLVADPVRPAARRAARQGIRFSRVYQTTLYMPVVLSLAVVGFIWQLVYSPDQGAINSIIGANEPGNPTDWLGDPDLNLWMVLLAASWRHTGYMMILYLAGLKGVDPSLNEAAALDGANEWQTFPRSSSRRCARSTSSSWSSPSSRRCAPSTSSTSSTRAATGWNCCRSWSPTTSSARPAGSDSAPPSPSSCCVISLVVIIISSERDVPGGAGVMSDTASVGARRASAGAPAPVRPRVLLHAFLIAVSLALLAPLLLGGVRLAAPVRGDQRARATSPAGQALVRQLQQRVHAVRA